MTLLKHLIICLLLTISSGACHKVEFNTVGDFKHKRLHKERQVFTLFGLKPITKPLSSKCRHGLGYAKVETTLVDVFSTVILGAISGFSASFMLNTCSNVASPGCLAKTVGMSSLILGAVSTRTVSYRCLP